MPTRGVLAAAALTAGLGLMLPWADRSQAQSQATIRGRVQIGVPITTRKPGTPYGSRSVSHPVLAPASELKHVVVYVRDAPARATPPRAAEIRQLNETFIPRVVAVPVGSEVDFPNDDPIYHNVFSLSRTKTFNLGRYPQRESRRVRFDKPGIVKVFCEIHSHMTATVMVFKHPWFAVPDEDGAFVLADLPSGAHDVTAWHERLGDTTVRVHADAGVPAVVDFTLPVPAE
jgi:plastocyanin